MIAKLTHYFFTLSVFEMTPFQPLHFISADCDTTLLQHKQFNVATRDCGRGVERGEIDVKEH